MTGKKADGEREGEEEEGKRKVTGKKADGKRREEGEKKEKYHRSSGREHAFRGKRKANATG